MAAEDPNSELGILIGHELMIVKTGGILIFKLFKLMEALIRTKMANERLTESQYKDIHQFIKDTGGEFTISNIPTQDPEKKVLFCEALRKAGVAFCDLPDLDLTDGLSQVAVRDRDLGRFQYVFEEFTAGQLSGGKRSLAELKGVTSNHYTIKDISLGDGMAKAQEMAAGAARLLTQYARQISQDGIPREWLPDALRKANGQQEAAELLKEQLIMTECFQKDLSDVVLECEKRGAFPEEEKEAVTKLQDLLANEHLLDDVKKFAAALEDYHITYSFMPDLNYTDRRMQVAVADANLPQFETMIRTLFAEFGSMDMPAGQYIQQGTEGLSEYLKRQNVDPETIRAVEEVLERRAVEGTDPKAPSLQGAVRDAADEAYYRRQCAAGGGQREVWAAPENVRGYDREKHCCYIRIPGEKEWRYVDRAVAAPGGGVSCFITLEAAYPGYDFRDGVPVLSGTGEAEPNGKILLGLYKKAVENPAAEKGAEPDKKEAETAPVQEKPQSSFAPPTLEDVSAYVLRQGLDHMSAEDFVDYYTARGWKMGGSPMEDWKAAARLWNRRAKERAEKSSGKEGKGSRRKAANYDDRQVDYDALIRNGKWY